MTKLVRSLCIAVLALSAGAAWADVAVINELAGDVLYGAGKSGAKATVFMKVRDGDAFTVGKGAKVRLLYLANGRQETFSGPARFVAGTDASRVQQGAAPQVQAVPPIVALKIGKGMELVGNPKLSRMGGITVRGGAPRLTPEQQTELASARQTYSELRTVAAEDDITPELFLYSVLNDLQLAGEMKTLAADMHRRQPSNAEIARMAQSK